MPVFMVERSLKGISMNDLGAAQKAAIATCSGTDVRYIRTTFVPDSGRCMCLFEASDAASVKALNDKAKLPYNEIVPALDLTP